MMPPDEPWPECPTGELTELQRSLREQQRRIRGRRRVLLAAGMVFVGMVSTGIVAVVSRQKASTSILSCQETVDLLPRYVDGTLADDSQRKAVEIHLKHCEQCREYFQKTY